MRNVVYVPKSVSLSRITLSRLQVQQILQDQHSLPFEVVVPAWLLRLRRQLSEPCPLVLLRVCLRLFQIESSSYAWELQAVQYLGLVVLEDQLLFFQIIISSFLRFYPFHPIVIA